MVEKKEPYKVIFDYDDIPTIRKFALDNSRVRILIGPFGSAKTSGCVMEVVRRAQQQPPSPDGIRRSRWAVVRNTYMQLKDTTIRSFHDWFPPAIFGEYRVTDHTFLLTRFPGVQLEILFRALDRPDQVSNLLSLELTGAYFNEIREIPKAIVDAMDGRIGRYPSRRDAGAYWHGMIGDTNAPDEDHWIYRVFEKGKKPDGWKLFKQPSGLSAHAENTTHLPKNYYVNLAKGKDEMYIRIYIHGQYGYLISGKPVFASFVDNVHVAPHDLEPIKGLPLIVGFDFALQPTCVLGQITPLGQLRILDELISDSMGLRQFCDNILLPHLRQNYFGYAVMGFGDPSGISRSPTDESTCFDILHSKDVGLNNVTEAPTNAIVPRVGAVEQFLNKMYKGEPGFIMSPKCHFLRKAMNGGYHYEKDPKSTSEEFKPMPVKNFSCVDMDTEILTFDGWKYRKEISVGEKVFGYKNGTLVGDTIENIFDYSGGVECIRFSSPMYEFIFTENHRCFTVHRNKQDIRIVTAGKISSNHSLLTSAYYKDDSSKLLITNWFIKLCAWVLTEGHYRKDGSIVIVQSIKHNPEYVKFIDELLLRSPYLVNRCIYNDVVRWKINKELAILIRYMMPHKCPSYEFVMKMRNPQRRLFLYECLRGDGFNGGTMPDKESIPRNREFWLNRRYDNKDRGKITPRFTAKRRLHIDVIQMIATMVGIETHIQTKRQKTSHAYDLSFINKRKINTSHMVKERVMVDSVWCPETSTGAWVMRRRGVVLITGNSHVSDALEYLCLYIAEKESNDARHKSFLAQLKKRDYTPAQNEIGY